MGNEEKDKWVKNFRKVEDWVLLEARKRPEIFLEINKHAIENLNPYDIDFIGTIVVTNNGITGNVTGCMDLKVQTTPYFRIIKKLEDTAYRIWSEPERSRRERMLSDGLPFVRYEDITKFIEYIKRLNPGNMVALNTKHFKKYGDNNMVLFLVSWNPNNLYDYGVRISSTVDGLYGASMGKIKRHITEMPLLYLYRDRNKKGEIGDYSEDGNSTGSYYLDIEKDLVKLCNMRYPWDNPDFVKIAEELKNKRV